MKIFKLGLVLSCLAIFVFACTQNTANLNTSTNKTTATTNVNGTTPANSNQSAPVTDELAAVKKIFSDKCVQCHKDNGEGGSVDIEGDKFKVPNLKDPKVAALDDKKYTRVIEEGDDKMPSFKKQLTPEQIADLIKYIRKEFQGK